MFTQYALAGAATAIYALLCRYCLRRDNASSGASGGAAPVALTPVDAAVSAGKPLLIAYASQSGNAEALAGRQAQALARNHTVVLKPLNAVDNALLSQFERALFVVSTFGEGEPPDNAIRFTRVNKAKGAPPLANLSYAVLALGDSQYRQFCAFGHRLHDMLSARGAQPLFAPVCVDKLDSKGLLQWRQQLSTEALDTGDFFGPDHAGTSPNDDDFHPWYIGNRQCINAGSPGNPVYHIRLLNYAGKAPAWRVGDIAEIIIPVGEDGSSLRREYSIASLPDEGSLDLVVRQLIKDDGSHGIGSGWLTQGLSLNNPVQLRIRSNPAFHPPGRSAREARKTPMILIGNGTGIAGLRAHIRAREQVRARQNWLIFGERTEAFDFHFGSQLMKWKNQHTLQRLDLAFSRDADCGAYVQHRLREAGSELKTWVERGAAIYVCGSRLGMAEEVHQTLIDLLGEQAVENMLDRGLYRRDIY